VRERADLHIHSTASDGAQSPAEIVREAAAAGLGAISIVDHDTVDGLSEAEESAEHASVHCVPGVEINTDFGKTEIHIIGYYIDADNRALREGLQRLRERRLERAAKIVSRLQELGVPVKLERVLEIAGRGSVGRPHIAHAICETGRTDGMNSAFGKYLVRGAPAFVPRARMAPPEAIGLIVGAGGVACLAHPGKIGSDLIVSQLLKAGLQAMEIYHTDHSTDVCRRYSRLAREYGLIETGGSDSHGMRTE